MLETTFTSASGTARAPFDFGSFFGGDGMFAQRGPVLVSVALNERWSCQK